MDTPLDGVSAESSGPRPVALIVNTQARAGTEGFLAAGRALIAHGALLVGAHEVAGPGELPELVGRALAAGARAVAVGGGDGTLSAVANLLAGTEVALGVIPLGTGNDFARTLRLPFALEDACEVIARGRVRVVPLGRVGERYFLNAASFGISSAITRRMSVDFKRRVGPLAYRMAAAAECLGATPFRLRLEAAGRAHELDALQVVVGNGRYHGGGQVIAPDARLGRPRLDVYAIQAAARGEDPAAQGMEAMKNAWLLARVALLLRKGRHLEHPNLLHLREEQVTISTEPPQEIDADGELAGTTPARFSVVPDALRVLAPEPRG